MTMHNIYAALIDQLDRLARHNRQGSYKTRKRYYEAMKRFCLFLALVYRLQKLTKISPKHVHRYVAFMQENGKAASTIKTDLAAIRFFHDKMDGAKYRMPTNDELNLEPRHFGGADRTWSNVEFNRMIGEAVATGRDDYCCAFYLTRFAGLRIHESFRIDTAIAENALRDGRITIKGKGGKIRTIPIEDERITISLGRMLKATPRGHKLLVPDDMPTDEAIYRLQLFILKHRDAIQTEGHESHLTYHGLRHTYAANKYKTLIAGGMSERDAHYEVSRLLGHERPDVTDIYLASVKKEKDARDGE